MGELGGGGGDIEGHRRAESAFWEFLTSRQTLISPLHSLIFCLGGTKQVSVLDTLNPLIDLVGGAPD